MKYLSDVIYREAEKIILVMDNLNIHGTASLYKRYSPAEARRIPTIERLRSELSAWEDERKCRQAKVVWQFRTKDARVKLKSLYPVLD